MREIGRRSGVNENTVRYYLIKHISGNLECLDYQEVIPNLRLKLVKIKDGYTAEGILKALPLIIAEKTEKTSSNRKIYREVMRRIG